MTEKELIELYLMRKSQRDLPDEDALKELWENTPSDSDVDMPRASELYSKARETERAMHGFVPFRSFVPWALAAACVLLAVVAMYVFRPEPVTRLVSSSASKGTSERGDKNNRMHCFSIGSRVPEQASLREPATFCVSVYSPL